jgi:predicted amidophosphoribosyltransferase
VSVCRRCRIELLAHRTTAQDAALRPPVAGVDGFTALFAYEGAVVDLVLAAKNGGRRDVLVLFGAWLALAVSEASGVAGPPGGAGGRSGPEPAPVPGPDAVTWVPASRSRRRQRGYDQGRILAGAVAAGLGSTPVAALARVGGGRQAGRSRRDRLVGPSLRPMAAAASRVLVVDDVATTGASLAVAASTLRAAGAARVSAAVVALAAGPVMSGDDLGRS